jgi:cytidine deaminase
VELPVAPRLSVCAEHAALTAAVAAGISPRAVVIWTVPEDPSALPCGVCRQVLAELAPKAALWLQQGDGAPRRLDAESLLPHPFDERALPGRRGQGAAEP